MSKPRDLKVETFRRERVNHAAAQRAFDEVLEELENARHEPGPVILAGPTGAGKTNLRQRLEWHITQQFKQEADTTGRLPFLTVTAAPPLNDTFNFRHFFHAMLVAAEDPFVSAHRALPSRRMTGEDLRTAALSMMAHRRPMFFCVDEAQHMTYAVRPRRMEEHMDLIKWLAIESRIPVLLVGTNELLKLPLLSDQLGRRTPHILLNPYRWDDGPELKQFRAVLRYFRDKLPVRLSFDIDERKNYELLFTGSCGAVGILKPWLDRSLNRCVAQGRSTLTLEDLIAKRHSAGKLKRIAKAISAGRAQQRVLDCDLDEVRAELGVEAAEKPKTPRPPRELKPGQRRLVRDTVGTDDEAAA